MIGNDGNVWERWHHDDGTIIEIACAGDMVVMAKLNGKLIAPDDLFGVLERWIAEKPEPERT